MVRPSMLALFTIVLLGPSGLGQEAAESQIRFAAPQTVVVLDDLNVTSNQALITPVEVPPPMPLTTATPLPNLAAMAAGIPGIVSIRIPHPVPQNAEPSASPLIAVPLVIGRQSARIAMQTDDKNGLAPAATVPKPVLDSERPVSMAPVAEVASQQVKLKDVVRESGRVFLGRSLHASNWRRQRIKSRPMPTERERADKIPAPEQAPEPTDD